MEENQNEIKPKRFHYAYIFEALFAIVTLGIMPVVTVLRDPLHAFLAWYGILILGGVVIFFLKSRMERDLRLHFGDEKTRLIYTVGVYWFEGGLFLAAVVGSLFIVVLRAIGKL